MGFLNFLQGVERQVNPFDNNATYKNPQGNGQQASVATQAKNTGVGLAKGAVAPPLFFLRNDIIDPAKQIAAQVTGNAQAGNNAVADEFKGATTPGQALRQVTGNAAQLGLTFLAPGIGRLADTAATGIIGAVAPGLAEKAVQSAAVKTALGVGGELLPKGLQTAIGLAAAPITGAAVGAPFNVAGTVASDQPLTAQNLVHSAVTGAGSGAVLGTGGELLHLGVKGAIDTLHPSESGSVGLTNEDITKIADANTIEDVKQVLKDKVSPEVAAEVAKPLSLTNNPTTIQDIIDKHTPVTPEAPPETTTTPSTDTTAPQERGFINTAQNSPQVSPEVKADLSSPLETRSDASVQANTQEFMKQDLPTATNQVHAALDKPLGSVTDQETSNAFAVAQQHDSLGTPEGHREAQAIYEKLAPQRTETARALRAGQILNSRTPDGLKFQAITDLGKAGVKVEGELQDNLNNAIEKVRGTAPNTDEHALAVQEVQKIVKEAIPSSAGDKAFALWRTGLLTGPSTVSKIITSHAGQGIFSIAKDYAGALVDKIVSGFTGQRALVAPGAQELGVYGKGFVTGFGDMKGYIQTGLEKDPITGNALELRNSTNFQHQLFQNYTDWVGRVHGSLYKPFNTGETFRSLFNQGMSAAKTAGLSGEDAQAFISDFVKNPPKDVAETAVHEGQVATFQQDTALGKAATQIQKLPIIGKLIAPFTKIPSAIATDLVNASPVGAVRTILDGIKAAKTEEGWTVQAQRDFSKGLGTSITGTAIMIPGIALFNKGIMTLGYPQDPTEQKLWAQEGKQPNSILIDGKWRSLGSLGPSGSVLEIGGHIANSLKQGNSLEQAVTDGFVGGAQSIEEQSYLKGVSGAINALNDPGRYAGNFVKQEAGSIVPTFASTIAAAGDNTQRQATSPLDTIKSRIPGLRETLPAKLDTFGNPLPNGNSGWQRIIDPFQSSKSSTSSPVTTELQRLQDAGFGIVPAKINKNETFNKIKTPLTPDQQRQLTVAIGQATQKAWESLVSRPGYQNMTDEQQKQQLSKIYTRIVTIQKQRFAAKNKFGRYAPNYLTKLHNPKGQ